MPLISVLIASYNHAKYIAEAIHSVLNQSFQDFEILIVDDGSIDGTVAEIKKFTDPRIRLFCFEENRSAAVAVHKLLDEAVGKYISLLSSDDIFLPDKLEKQITFLEKHSEIAAVFGYAQIVDEDGKDFNDDKHFYFNRFKQPNRTRYEWLNYFFHHGNCLCHPSVLIRKLCYETLGYYDERLAQIPDFDFWIRLCLRYEIFIIPENLVKFRIRENEKNASGDRPETRIRSAVEYNRVTLKEYLKITDSVEFLKVFPEAERYVINGEISPEYALARMCLAENMPNCFKLFGLEILFNILDDPVQSKKVKQFYNFSFRDLIAETGKHDVFSQLPRERLFKAKIYLDFGQGYSEKYALAKTGYLPAGGIFRLEFDLTPLLQETEGASIQRIRFDPNEGVPCKCSIIDIPSENGFFRAIPYNSIKSTNHFDIFISIDPIYTLSGDFTQLHELIICGTMHPLENEEIEEILKSTINSQKQIQDELSRSIQKLESAYDLICNIKDEINKMRTAPIYKIFHKMHWL